MRASLTRAGSWATMGPRSAEPRSPMKRGKAAPVLEVIVRDGSTIARAWAWYAGDASVEAVVWWTCIGALVGPLAGLAFWTRP